VRSEAVSDVWVQYEGCDDYGPEHGSYEHIPYLVNDIEHWRIIERLSYDQDDDEGFDAEDFERVAATVFPTDRYLESMKESGDFSDVEYEKELEKFRIRANKIEELATLVKYQFSNGTMRSVDCYAQEVELYGALHELVIYGPDMDPGEICAPICLEIEGRYKRAWINPKTIDYISVPAHQYDIGSVLASIEDD
jgi:hypothetical protein